MPRIATVKESIELLCNIEWEYPKQGVDFKKELDDAWAESKMKAIKVARSWGGGSIKDIKEALEEIYNTREKQ